MLLLTPVTALAPGAEERLVDVMDPLSVALGTLLWAVVIHLGLVHGSTIRSSIRTDAWDSFTTSLVLFVIGFMLFQASVLVSPVALLAEAADYEPVFMPQVKLTLLFLTATVLVLFLADWCSAFNLRPRVLARENLSYAVFSLLVAGAGTALPIVYNRPVPLDSYVQVYPVTAIAAFVMVNAYFTLSGALAVRERPVFDRFKWIIVDSVLITAFLCTLVYEYWVFPPHLFQSFFPEILFYTFAGFTFIIAGYVYKLRALISFIRSFVLEVRVRTAGETASGPVTGEVLNHLAAKFVAAEELEKAIAEVCEGNDALEKLSFDPENRSFGLEDLDINDKSVQEGMSALFFSIVDLLLELEPPRIDRVYSEDELKDDIFKHVTNADGRPPPGIEGYILPQGLVLAQAVSEVLNTFLSTIPLKAGFSTVVINAIDGVWGGEFVRADDDNITFDGDAFLMFCKKKTSTDKEMVRYISRLYLRAHRLALEPFKSFMSREKMEKALRENIREVVNRPLYRAAGVSDVMMNAFFADNHAWGFDAIERECGKLPNKYSVLLTYDSQFPKDLFISSFIAANLRTYRNAAWLSSIRTSVAHHLLSSQDIDVDSLLEDGRFMLVSLDPNIEETKTTSPGCSTVNTGFNSLSYELGQIMESFPISSILVVIELPVSAIKSDTTRLYKFLHHITALCDRYDATALLVADISLCGDETAAMLKELTEIVISTKDEEINIMDVARSTARRFKYRMIEGDLIIDRPVKGPDDEEE